MKKIILIIFFSTLSLSITACLDDKNATDQNQQKENGQRTNNQEAVIVNSSECKSFSVTDGCIK